MVGFVGTQRVVEASISFSYILKRFKAIMGLYGKT